jgi:predicted metal-binding protein
LEKYIALAKQLKMTNALMISPKDVCFDKRVLLKCIWGCSQKTVKCDKGNTTFQERLDMVTKYHRILLVHAHNARDVTKAVLEIERQAFLDGHYLAFAIRYCNYCEACQVDEGKPCTDPKKIRPCESIFGIDVYQTVKNIGLPINVLQSKDALQNRYGFILID